MGKFRQSCCTSTPVTYGEASVVPGNVLKASEPKRSVESSDDKSWVRMEEDLAAPLLLGLLLTGGWKREQDVRNGAGRAAWRQPFACCQRHQGFWAGIFNSSLLRSRGMKGVWCIRAGTAWSCAWELGLACPGRTRNLVKSAYVGS